MPPGDPVALAAVLRRLLDDPGYRRRLGDGAAAIVEADHDAARNAAAIVALIAETVAQAQGRPRATAGSASRST